MASILGKIIGMIINIVLIPIVLILAVPIGILKSRNAKKNRLLFTGVEQSLLAKAQHAINMDTNGLISPDRDLLEVARCIENARCDYQLVKSRERFDSTFSDFLLPRINNCNVINWDNVENFFELSNYTKFEEVEDVRENKLADSVLPSHISADNGMRLEVAEVDVLSIVCNNKVLYLNSEANYLFTKDKDGDEKLDGRVVNFIFSGQSEGTNIEIFVAFDDFDSYTMFTLKTGIMERLNYVSQAILKYFSENGVKNVFSVTESYSTQYVYTFKAYRKNGKYFMVNNAQTQAYLIDKSSVMRENIDEIKNIFWKKNK